MTNLSNIVEILAKQALGGNQQNGQQSQQGGIGGILGSVLGGLTGQQQNQQQGGLGGILGSVLGNLTGGQQSTTPAAGAFNAQSLLIAVVPLVLAWIQKNGGLQGALDQLKGQGLTSQVEDWVSTGPGENANIPTQSVQNLFDQQDVESVAEKAQVPTQDVYSAISSVLPQIIDSLTPQAGQTNQQEANSDIQNVMNLVSGFFKK